MPSSASSLHGSRFVLKKMPLLPLSSHPLSTSASMVKDAQFKQLPPILHHFLTLLQEFSRSIIHVKSIHAQIITNFLSSDEFVATKLVKTYSDLGRLCDARKVFDRITDPKVFLWNAMMGGYLRNERYIETLELYRIMRSHGLHTDSCTCTFALKACTSLSNVEIGTEILKEAAGNGLSNDPFFGSSMINFLVKCGNIDEAQRVFNEIPQKDVVCWNSIIGGYVQVGSFDRAFDLFSKMRHCGIRPSAITMVNLIHACGGTGNLDIGKSIHASVNCLGLSCDILVLTSLVDMYSKMGDIESAQQVFNRMPSRNLVSWNAMISGYVQNGLVCESFELFYKLILSGSAFDSATIVSLLQACAHIACLNGGKILHACAYRRGFESNLIVLTAIVDLYVKCGALNLSTSVFNRMKGRNVISWTAMLVGLAQNGHAEDALKLFGKMQEEGVAANSVTLVSLIHACSHLGSLKKGKSVHAHLLRCGFIFDTVNLTALIDMYAKCGTIESAERLFNNRSLSNDIVLWNSMITTYGIHGNGHNAIRIYNKMKEEGLVPNHTTLISLLSACSHSGLVEEGIAIFHSMSIDHGVKPGEKHYACLVDLLSRAGRLEEAEALINQMPFAPSDAVLEALLSGCRTHKNIDMGIRTADKLLSLDSMDPGIYVMLSNIYAEGRRWGEVDYVRGIMRKRGLRKTPGYSLIEVCNQVHAFFSGDDSHPLWEEIHLMLEGLRIQIEASYYVPHATLY
ncbi:PREDICTED: pentatricopeptide repeat-containing protein At1g06140, mitochondrial-like [Nelumbo nucifera]|uniref:Uncharacterized protein n=2 Tax=Nelumbo nucifera TaxID=4432 RepID=A0A822YTX2_NELNU|nr:PREDICTED: pentatricopeptide repeat-containing protein At1g06140, mitochondrial-like [Nelumbo nucifera]DAD35960.1 TPA_asm: hypothetical protein HUJ06_006600 [Nelumbo nucifera]